MNGNINIDWTKYMWMLDHGAQKIHELATSPPDPWDLKNVNRTIGSEPAS